MFKVYKTPVNVFYGDGVFSIKGQSDFTWALGSGALQTFGNHQLTGQIVDIDPR